MIVPSFRTASGCCLVALAALVCPPLASAQRLDLGGVRVPEPGEGKAALAVASLMEEQARTIEARDTSAAGRVRSAARRLAAALIRSGEEAGERGSVRVVTGRTLAVGMADLDLLLTNQTALAEPTLHAVADELAFLGAAVPPDDNELDRSIRDAFAPLTMLAGAPGGAVGWFVGGERGLPEGATITRLADTLVAIGDGSGLPNDTAAAVYALAKRTRLAAGWPAYVRSAEAVAAGVLEAHVAVESLPAWVTREARERLRGERDRAIVALTNASLAPSAMASLRDLRTLASIAARLDAIDAARAGSRQAREAWLRLVVVDANDVRRAGASPARIGAAMDRALSLVEARAALPDESAVARQVRPALRALADAARDGEPRVLAVMAGVLEQPDPLTDPAIVAALNAQQRALDDARMLVALNRLLCEWVGAGAPGDAPAPETEPRTREPTPVRAMLPLAERVRVLGVELGRPASREGALAELRTLAETAPLLFDMPGLAELTADPGERGWRDATGGRGEEIARAAAAARAAWVESASSDRLSDRRGADTERLRTLAATLAVQRDAASYLRLIASPAPMPGAAQSWPGWEMSARGLASLGPRVRAEAASRALALRDEAPGALLAGRLERLAAARGVGTRRGLLHEVALGPPREGSWLADRRGVLAAVCRYAEEAAHAAASNEAGRAEELLRYVNDRAKSLLASLPEE
ncbi:MAG: hypothetical protein KIS87_10600 [Phycisphaeraceae bacterium]|nr:hypothetical protein [Phycisphaeraceae bacterium]